MSKKRAILKVVVGSAAALGAGFIVNSIIKQHVVPVKLVHKVTVAVATAAISSIVAREAVVECENVIDESFDFIAGIKKNYREFIDQMNGVQADTEPDTDEVEATPSEA